MRHYPTRSAVVVLFIFFGCFTFFSRIAQSSPPPFDADLSPIEDTKAYKMFLMRPYSELSKIVFLIDRFKESKVKVVYDDIYFDAAFAARVAKWFLSQHYRKENAREWIMLYCNQSLVDHKLIWVADEKGGFKLSREVLLSALQELEEVCAHDPHLSSPKKFSR